MKSIQIRNTYGKIWEIMDSFQKKKEKQFPSKDKTNNLPLMGRKFCSLSLKFKQLKLIWRINRINKTIVYLKKYVDLTKQKSQNYFYFQQFFLCSVKKNPFLILINLIVKSEKNLNFFFFLLNHYDKIKITLNFIIFLFENEVKRKFFIFPNNLIVAFFRFKIKTRNIIFSYDLNEIIFRKFESFFYTKVFRNYKKKKKTFDIFFSFRKIKISKNYILGLIYSQKTEDIIGKPTNKFKAKMLFFKEFSNNRLPENIIIFLIKKIFKYYFHKIFLSEKLFLFFLKFYFSHILDKKCGINQNIDKNFKKKFFLYKFDQYENFYPFFIKKNFKKIKKKFFFLKIISRFILMNCNKNYLYKNFKFQNYSNFHGLIFYPANREIWERKELSSIFLSRIKEAFKIIFRVRSFQLTSRYFSSKKITKNSIFLNNFFFKFCKFVEIFISKNFSETDLCSIKLKKKIEFFVEFQGKTRVEYRWKKIISQIFLIIDCYSFFVRNHLIFIKNLKKSSINDSIDGEKCVIKNLIYAEKNLNLKIKIFSFACKHAFAKLSQYVTSSI